MNTMRTKLVTIFLLLVSSLAGSARGARAQDCWTVFVPPDAFQTVCAGEGGGGEQAPPPSSCTPGSITLQTITMGGDALCEVWTIWYDPCTGEIVYASLVSIIEGGSCSAPPPEPALSPCVVLRVDAGGIYCQTEWGEGWRLEARVSFPETFLDLRPFPATLVRWPSAARNGGQPAAFGTGQLDYLAYGNGTPADPALGDWRDVRLTLRLNPAGPMFFTMPEIGTLALPDVDAAGLPVALQWEMPSHPAAGGGALAGSVSGLGGLPPDLPLFLGSAHSPYRLFWQLAYQEYSRACAVGPDPETDRFTCRASRKADQEDGHWEYTWEDESMGGEITPAMVEGLPASLAADLNGDGLPEAYWNHNVTIRRMDENNRVDNPQWEASWNWGGIVYWAVREGQGQVGWP